MARTIYCAKCKLEKEEKRRNQSYCKKCYDENRLAKLSQAISKPRKSFNEWISKPRGIGPKKDCRDCGEPKQDIRQTYCNPCRSKRAKEWRLETGRTQHINTGLCACGKAKKPYSGHCPECKALQAKKDREKAGRDKLNAYARSYYSENKEKILERKRKDPMLKLKVSVRNMTNNAIQAGILIRQPCEKCGTTENIEAHYDDYTKPLDIRWLCKFHHDEHHGHQVILKET